MEKKKDKKNQNHGIKENHPSLDSIIVRKLVNLIKDYK